MVEFYKKLVLAGKLSVDEIPEKYREKVRQQINAD